MSRIKEAWGVAVYAIGKPPSTYFPEGVIPQEVSDEDRLEDSIRLLSGALGSISSNSGPTHLSLMASCPTFAWGERYLVDFIERVTNPLGTPCKLCPLDWSPTVDEVWAELARWRDRLIETDQWYPRSRGKGNISLCMIARDNERTLPAALGTAAPWFDELVVVDTGSKDRTQEIARSHGAKVVEFPWCDDFAAARNRCLEAARSEWAFWMDSDDTLSEENGRRIRELVCSPGADRVHGFVVQVHCGSDPGAGVTVVDHVKLLRNLPAIRFEGRIHEQVLPSIRRLGGDVGWSDIFVSHTGADYSAAGRARKLDRDLRILGKDLAERPGHPFVPFNLGMTQTNAGHHGAAVESLTRCIQASQTGESHTRKAYALLATALIHASQADEARRRCWEGLGRYPGDPEVLFLSGNLAQADGRLADAEAAYRGILEHPHGRHFSSMDAGINGFKTRQNLAAVLEENGRWSEAEALWLAIVDEQPGYREGWRGLCQNLIRQQRFADVERMLDHEMPAQERYLIEAKLAESRSELEKAADAFARAISADPDDLPTHDARCRFLFETQSPEAEAALRRLGELKPEDGSVPHNLGLIRMRDGRWEAAKQAFDESLAVRPMHAPTAYFRGVALRELGHADAAVDAWRQAIDIDPQHMEARAALNTAK